MQRLMDILFSGLAILVLSPLLLAIMLVLRLSGEGEVFFVQKRIGKNAEPFGLFKFATMMKNSESIGTGTVTVKNDPRVLPVGKFLRKTKINELPQLFNIFKGDMSIIGPRPQTQRCFDAFPPSSQKIISQTRPGLSGMGSIIFRNEDEMMDSADDANAFYDTVIMPYKGKVEEWFVSKSNIGLYVILIVLTAWVVLFSKSKLVWQLFKDLPEPPNALKTYCNYPMSVFI